MTANGVARFGPNWEEQTDERDISPDHVLSDEDKELIDMLNKISGVTSGNSDQLEDFDPLLDPQETKSPNQLKWTYRGRFLDGKEEEMAAAEETYAAMYPSPSNGHRQALHDCRRYAQFAREKKTGEVKVMSDACRDRYCPMCAAQKFQYAKQSTMDFLATVKKPRFLTLTLRNSPGDLKSQVEFLQLSFRRLRQRAYWKKNVRGGMWYMEIKRGKNSDMWHPHLHILLDGNYMEQGTLSDLWDLVTYGSPILYIVNITDQERAAGYVAKYSAKPAQLASMPLEDRIEVFEAMFRKRMCGTFGNAKEFTLTPPKVPLDGEWSPIGWHDDVVRDAESNPAAKAVLIAYNNYTNLTEEQYFDYTGTPVHVIATPLHKKVDKQLYMDFYGSNAIEDG